MENKDTPMYDKFIRKNLVASEKGTEEQQGDMSSLVAQTSKVIRELGDILSGKRKQIEHTHHPVNSLVNGSVDGIKDIVKLRKDIESNNK